jgi:hypothetical protein
MLVADLDEVTYDLEVDGELVRRTLQRRVWERGAWATVAIAYQERDPEGAWKPAKLALIRLQRVRDAWKKHAAINLQGDDAMRLAEVVGEWRGALSTVDQPAPPFGGAAAREQAPGADPELELDDEDDGDGDGPPTEWLEDTTVGRKRRT